MRGHPHLAASLAGLLIGAGVGWGEIALTVSPARTSVSLIVYGNADLTLVREVREVWLANELTEVALQWPGAAVDASSVRLRAPDDVKVSPASQPPRKADEVRWALEAERPGAHALEITYFTSGIEWKPTYRLTMNEGTGAVTLEGAVTLRNRSGQEFEDPEVRLVVGELQLIENLAEAAWKQLPAYKDEQRGAPPAAGSGLSERYVYDLGRLGHLGQEDTYTVPFLPSTGIEGAAILYRMHEAKYKDGVHRLIVFENVAGSGLGLTPMARASVQVYAVSAGGLLPERAAVIPYTPVGEECEIDLGPTREVAAERRVVRRERTNFEFDRFANVEGFDDRESLEVELSNYALRPITIEYTDTVPGVWEVVSDEPFIEEGLNEAVFSLELAPQTTRMLGYRLIKRQGKRVRLGPIRPR